MARVLMTGASSGIGFELAKRFARDDHSLVLVARSAERLEEVAKKLNGTSILVPADLSQPGSAAALFSELRTRSIEIEILVNCAGFGASGWFAQTDLDVEREMMQLNMVSLTELTKLALPDMIRRRAGRILNVASVYSFAPVPFQSVYAACKAFLLSFSSALQNELQGTGVTVTVFCPGATRTEFRSRAGIGQKRSDSGMPAEAAARIAYLETMRGKHIVVPGFINRIFVYLTQFLPDTTVPSLVRFINRQRGQTHS